MFFVGDQDASDAQEEASPSGPWRCHYTEAAQGLVMIWLLQAFSASIPHTCWSAVTGPFFRKSTLSEKSLLMFVFFCRSTNSCRKHVRCEVAGRQKKQTTTINQKTKTNHQKSQPLNHQPFHFCSYQQYRKMFRFVLSPGFNRKLQALQWPQGSTISTWRRRDWGGLAGGGADFSDYFLQIFF